MGVLEKFGKDSQPSSSSSSSSLPGSQPCRHFEFSEIQLATHYFDESLVIGHGGFGKVYRATISNDSTPVDAAIKRLDSMSNQGPAEFWAEVEMLSKLRHCNLVSLIGYCNYGKEMILVYEYLPNGTLEDHLHKLGTPLSWILRINICIGAGRGLHYLHTGTGIDVGVMHRDVKSSNILLHESWAAKISDFGLSKIGPTNQPSTYVNTLVKGTFGYFDPDYYATGKLTRKSDVYAFGVVLLEVLCRKRAVDTSLDEEQWNLARWAQESIKEGNLKHIIDTDIRGQISSKCLKEFVRTAQRCLHSNPKQRCTMAEVVASLESVLNLQEKFNDSLQTAGKTIFGRMIAMFPFSSNIEISRPIDPRVDLITLQMKCNIVGDTGIFVKEGETRGMMQPSGSHTPDDIDGECSRLAVAGEARVLVANGVKKRDDDVSVRGINENRLGNECSEASNGVGLANAEKARVLENRGDDDTDKTRERRHAEGENGIKGPRPPLLALPPAMSRVIVDDMGSNWDLIRSFAPRDNEDLASDGPVGEITSSNVVANVVGDKGIVIDEGGTSGMMTSRINTVAVPFGSDTLDDEDDGSSCAAAELQYSLSPNGSFKGGFKNWQKGDFLGSGSFGTVYEGYNEDGYFFAVKEVSLLDQGSQGKQSIAQLEQEISLLSQFHHDNIVRYLGTDTDNGRLYILLELVTKGSLATLYQKYELRDSQVSCYTRQILSGLNYLHERNVVHRDIKCANILVDASGSVKIADFGLAKVRALNDINSCKGTPYWLAPENVVLHRPAADIWSLGCTVLEMLTRKIPYSHLEGMQALFRIGRGEPPPIPDTLSVEAKDFILKCLQVNPNDRPTAAQLLEHPFLKRSSSINSALASINYNGIQL